MPVFISYSQKDEAMYSALCLALDGAKIKRWDVSSLNAGDSLADQLRNAIEICDVCVFLATKRSIESQWCLAELGAFWGAGKTVIGYIADPELKKSELPPQFKGNLWTANAGKLVKSIRSSYEEEKYDVFLAVPMAAYDNEKDYQTARAEVLKVCEAFREHCNYQVYCAVEQCPTMKSFETADVSVKVDLKAIRQSHNFVMLYPRKILSSILLEAGFALAIRKYSLYFANDSKDLPYMLQAVSSVFPDACLEEQPCSTNYDLIVDKIRINKHHLFESGSG